jgi:hypothetical protein
MQGSYNTGDGILHGEKGIPLGKYTCAGHPVKTAWRAGFFCLGLLRISSQRKRIDGAGLRGMFHRCILDGEACAMKEDAALTVLDEHEGKLVRPKIEDIESVQGASKDLPHWQTYTCRCHLCTSLLDWVG